MRWRARTARRRAGPVSSPSPTGSARGAPTGMAPSSRSADGSSQAPAAARPPVPAGRGPVPRRPPAAGIDGARRGARRLRRASVRGEVGRLPPRAPGFRYGCRRWGGPGLVEFGGRLFQLPHRQLPDSFLGHPPRRRRAPARQGPCRDRSPQGRLRERRRDSPELRANQKVETARRLGDRLKQIDTCRFEPEHQSPNPAFPLPSIRHLPRPLPDWWHRDSKIGARLT